VTTSRVSPTDVVCLGETMGQFVPSRGADFVKAKSFKLHHAGAESNVAVGLATLGHSVVWVSRLGDDALGTRISNDLAARGVVVSLPDHFDNSPTGLFLKIPEDGATTVSYYRGGSAASKMDETDAERALGLNPKIVHLSGVTPALSASCDAAVSAVLRLSREKGSLVSFDVNYRAALWPDILTAGAKLLELASLCDLVFVGLDEAERIWGITSPEAVRAILPDVTRLVVKDGSRRAIEFSTTTTTEVPALPIEVVEAVGAGDAFAAGYLSGVLAGREPIFALRAGHLMARQALLARSDYGKKLERLQLETSAVDDAMWTKGEEMFISTKESP
jgi:2-dehydro-3-deoxygluconokinase